MIGTTTRSRDDDHSTPWRQWQLDYDTSSRQGMRHARVVFGIAMAAALVWLGLQAFAW